MIENLINKYIKTMDFLGRPTKRIRREVVVDLEAADEGNAESVTELQTIVNGSISDLVNTDT